MNFRPEKVPFHYLSFPDKANPSYNEILPSPKRFVIKGLLCSTEGAKSSKSQVSKGEKLLIFLSLSVH